MFRLLRLNFSVYAQSNTSELIKSKRARNCDLAVTFKNVFEKLDNWAAQLKDDFHCKQRVQKITGKLPD